jgi:hypothetical protein
LIFFAGFLSDKDNSGLCNELKDSSSFLRIALRSFSVEFISLFISNNKTSLFRCFFINLFILLQGNRLENDNISVNIFQIIKDIVFNLGNKESKMAKFIKVKFPQLLLLLISFLFCFITACGNGGDTTTTTTTTGTGEVLSIAASPTSMTGGQASIITATVTDSTGNPISGAPVNFAFSNSSPNGAFLVSGSSSSTTTATTDAKGNAVVAYKANNVTSTAQDIIQASYSDASNKVIITITASSSSASGYQLAITANPSSVLSGQSSVITATLTDGSGKPVSGSVNFAFANSSPNGAFLVSGSSSSTATVATDGYGNAVVSYKANTVTSTAQDIIQASYSEGGYAAVIVTITTSTTTTTGYQLTIAANPASQTTLSGVSSYSSVITATVKDSSGNGVNNADVTFTFLGTNTGTLSGNDVSFGTVSGKTSITVITDSSGNATVTDTLTTTGQDVIQATVTSGSITYSTDVIVTVSTGS